MTFYASISSILDDNALYGRERETWTEQLRRAKALDGVAGRALKQEQSAEDVRVQQEIDDRVRAKSGG